MKEVFVSNEWLAKAKDWGTERVQVNGGNNTPAYAHTGRLPYSNLTANRLAVVAEVGAHLLFGVDPEATTFVVDRTAANYEALRTNADLVVAGRKIEVRNSAVTTSPLPIKQKDVAANAIVVQAHVEMKDKRPTGRVYFLGWADAATDYAITLKKRHGTAYRFAKREMETLDALLSGEQVA